MSVLNSEQVFAPTKSVQSGSVPTESAPARHDDSPLSDTSHYTSPEDILETEDSNTVLILRDESGALCGFTIDVETEESGHIVQTYNFSWPCGEMRSATLDYISDAFRCLKYPETAVRGFEILDHAKECGLIHLRPSHALEVDQFPEFQEEIETLSTREALEIILAAHDISTELWTGENKTIDKLVRELEDGETRLMRDAKTGEVYLYTIVSRLDLYHETESGEQFHLREKYQRLYDGSRENFTVRYRNLPTSVGEKLYTNESTTDAAQRVLREELKIFRPLAFSAYKLSAVVEERSADYPAPNLKHKKLFGNREAIIPESEFQPEYLEEDDDKLSVLAWYRVR